eukprot:jgi/Tetstr1/426316/TSEL_016632.t1
MHLFTGEERVAERIVYARFFDTTAVEPSSNVVDGLLNTLDDKRLEVILHLAAKARAAVYFKGGGGGSGGGGGGGGGNIRIKAQKQADRATNERADKNKDKARSRASLSPPATLRRRLLPGRPRRRTNACKTLPRPHLTFHEGEHARFVKSDAWEFGTCRKWVSRLFLVPKLGVD